MDRRSFLTVAFAASALVAEGSATAAATAAAARNQFKVKTRGSAVPKPPPPQVFTPQFVLPPGPIWGLPDAVGGQLAWTVDDGSSPEVTMAYARFAEETGTRLTFFINGIYAASWTPVAPVLAPLIASGQVQMANHTFSHPSLLRLTDAQIQAELMQNHQYILDTFGVDARPYYRPPYGERDARTDAAAAAVGYTCPVMWYGSLGDSGLITPEVMMSEADKWLAPARIILGHANAPTVTTLFPWLTELLATRGLTAVTLNDVFVR